MGSLHQVESRDSLVKQIDKILSAIVRIEETETVPKYIPLQASIDTYAKKLFISKANDDFEMLKAVLCVYFTFEQTIQNVDLRYDSFFASIIKDVAYKLPKSINIISWNYDLQFELAYSKFTNDNIIQNNMSHLKVVTKLTRENRENLQDRFSIFKVNGTAAFHDVNDKLCPLFRPNESFLPATHAIEWFSAWRNSRTYFSSLSFAWELEDKTYELLELLKVACKDTTTLVIIGYSIPFFNRDVDRKIIEAMPGLNKVYFQSPEADALKERFSAFKEIGPSRLISKPNTDQFYLPNELSL